MNSDGAVIHIIPASAIANPHLGSYKDVISRVRYLQAFPGYRQVLLDGDDAGPVLAESSAAARPAFLFEYSKYPKSVRQLRSRYPDSFIAVRAHNIEPLQHLDNVGWWPRKGPLWTLYGMARLALGDIACKRHADAIYSINEWENERYWQRLPGAADVKWLPYHCPEHLLPSGVAETRARNRIVCLPTSQRNRKSLDLVERFHRFAEAADKARPGRYEFLLTGSLDSWNLPASGLVTRTGIVDDLAVFLGTAKAVCMLSPLGYGFKTTIGDALAHECVPIVHPQLRKRLPAEYSRAVLEFDTEAPEPIGPILERLESERGRADLDRQSRARAEEMLAKDFQLPGDRGRFA